MQPKKLLYVIDERDNVATALDELRGAETLPVRSAQGTSMGELTLQSHVPRFFKVAIRPLADGEQVVKWGKVIGTVKAGAYTIQPGTVVHITNFLPSPKLIEFWGGDPIAFPANKIIESGYTPFEMGEVKRKFQEGGNIVFADLKLPAGFPDLLPSHEPDFVVGRAVKEIDKGHQLHLGCVVAGDYMFKGNQQQIDAINMCYKFLRGKIYGIAEDIPPNPREQ